MISVVIPVYNENSGVPKTIRGITQAIDGTGHDYEIIVVDDGSRDATPTVLADMEDSVPALRVVRFTRNFGKEAALHAGIDAARGNAIITIDADLQHPPELIPAMLKLWESGTCMVVNAQRNSHRRAHMTRWPARMFYRIFSNLSGVDIDNQTDFKLIDRRVADAYLALEERKLFYRALIAWLGFPTTSIQFDPAERSHGRSKWSRMALVATAADALASFSARPLQAVTLLGTVFLVFSGAIGGLAIYQKATGSAEVGFTTVILVVLISSSLLMISIGVIGKYLANIHDEVKRRPRYIENRRDGE